MILITGLNGFLSSALIDKCLESGVDVAVLTKRCEDPGPYPFHIIEADLLDADLTKSRLSGFTFQGVIHAAAAMDGVVDTQIDSSGNYLNVRMTKNLVAALTSCPPSHFTFISSIDVYDPSVFAQSVTEKAELSPATEYGKSKLESEQVVEDWARVLDITPLILRVTQIYGEKDRTRKLIPSVISRIKDGKAVQLFGDGSDLRDYIYSRDVARLALELHKKNASGIYNLTTGQSRSLEEVIGQLICISGKKVEIEYHERSKKRVDYRFDCRKVASILPDFEFTDFKKSLRDTYDHMS